ncbi:MAG: ribosome maturation factor RimM [Bacteroidia bacterium]
MKKEDCVEIGYIAKAHGLKGEVTAALDVFDLSDYRKVKTLYLSKKSEPLKAWTVKKLTPTAKKMAILELAESNSRESAESLIGTTLYFPVAELTLLPEDNFYFFEVIGFSVEDKNLGSLGTVKDFADGPAQNIMIIDYQGHEVLVPVTDDFVLHADKENKIIHTALPDGLLDLYMGNESEDDD